MTNFLAELTFFSDTRQFVQDGLVDCLDESLYDISLDILNVNVGGVMEKLG